jgi:hypothetical protein
MRRIGELLPRAFAALLAGTSVAAADCPGIRVPLNLCDGCESVAYMVVRKNETCRQTVSTSGSVDNFVFTRFAIAERPQHGKAGTSGLSIAYIPQPGYTGPDSLAIKADFVRNGSPGSMRIRYIVEVK